MNIGRMLDPDDFDNPDHDQETISQHLASGDLEKLGINPDWAKPDSPDVSSEAEAWLSEMNYHSAGAKVLNVARDIVRKSRSL